MTCNSAGTFASRFLEHLVFAAATVTKWTWWRGNGWDNAFDTYDKRTGRRGAQCDKLWQARCTYESETTTSHFRQFFLPHLSDLDLDPPNWCNGENVSATKHSEFLFRLLFIWNIFHFQRGRKSHIFWLHFGHTESQYARRTCRRPWADKISRFICFVIFCCFVKTKRMEKALAKWKCENRRNIEVSFYFRTKRGRLASRLQDMGLFDCIAPLSHTSKQFYTLHRILLANLL